MLLYPVYKQIKQRLNSLGIAMFWYTGQYQKGKDNTSYRVPAIYIEMPKDSSLVFYGRKLLTAKNVPITIHYISSAPFKAVDNSIQDSAIASHENILKIIDILLDGWNAVDTNGKILTQQLMPKKSDTLNFMAGNVVSRVTYTTDIFSRHLQTP